MQNKTELMIDLQHKLNANAPWKTAVDQLITRDRGIVVELTEYLNDIIPILLSITGEAIIIDLKDRTIDVPNSTTQTEFIFRQEQYRNDNFNTLTLVVIFTASSVHVQGGPPMGREPRYYIPQINDLLASNFNPQSAVRTVAGDFGPIRL